MKMDTDKTRKLQALEEQAQYWEDKLRIAKMECQVLQQQLLSIASVDARTTTETTRARIRFVRAFCGWLQKQSRDVQQSVMRYAYKNCGFRSDAIDDDKAIISHVLDLAESKKPRVRIWAKLLLYETLFCPNKKPPPRPPTSRLTAEEAAEWLGIPRRTFFRRIDNEPGFREFLGFDGTRKADGRYSHSGRYSFECILDAALKKPLRRLASVFL